MNEGEVVLQGDRNRVLKRADGLGVGRSVLEGIEGRSEQTVCLLDGYIDLQDRVISCSTSRQKS